jgi:hypothetical protein
MTKIRSFSVAFVLTIGLVAIPGSAFAAPAELQCRHSAAEYAQALKHFETQVEKARAQASVNPLYESDVGYYTAVLADVKSCLLGLAPVTTAAR